MDKKTQRVRVLLSCHLAYGLIEVMPFIHGWGRNIKGTPPDLDLCLAVLGSGLSLVQSSQATVVALIESPGSVDRQPHLVNAVQDIPQGTDGPL